MAKCTIVSGNVEHFIQISISSYFHGCNSFICYVSDVILYIVVDKDFLSFSYKYGDISSFSNCISVGFSLTDPV